MQLMLGIDVPERMESMSDLIYRFEMEAKEDGTHENWID